MRVERSDVVCGIINVGMAVTPMAWVGSVIRPGIMLQVASQSSQGSELLLLY